MHAIWLTVIVPLLEAYRPTTVAELGPGDDVFTTLLAEELSKWEAKLVHPGEHPGQEVPVPEMALVHGQPNWHQTTENLGRLAEMSGAAWDTFPVTLVHGVDWPDGRRDRYLDLAAIPPPDRQPHAPQDGIETAIEEHNRRNGVLSAIEDFRAGRGEALDLVHVPGLGGTAILVPEERLRRKSAERLSAAIQSFQIGSGSLAHLAAVDAERAIAVSQMQRLSAELELAGESEAPESATELDVLRRRIEELVETQADLKEAVSRRDARIVALEEDRKSPPSPVAEATARSVSSLPQPVDRRGLLVNPAETADADTLRATVRMKGSANELRLTIWSLLSRADRPFRLTLALDKDSSEEARSLAREVAELEPKVEVVAGAAAQPRDAWHLLVGEPLELAHGTLSRLIAAAEGDVHGPTAAVSATGAGVPGWAGADCLSLLTKGSTVEASGAGSLASACVVVPPGASEEEPIRVALDAAVVSQTPTAAGQPAVPGSLRDALTDEASLATAIRERIENPLSIAYLLPAIPAEGSGGSHSIFQEAAALRSIGAEVKILMRTEFAERAASLYPGAGEIVAPYSGTGSLAGGLAEYDVVSATDAPSARAVAAHVKEHPEVLGAYYVQDYEPLFSPAGSPSADTALISYRQAAELLLFAKTHWIANMVAAAHGVPVAKVAPSLDRSLFHAQGRRPERSPLRLVAMTRPRTPRRRAAETRAALARLKQVLGDAVECVSFGCGSDELASLPPAAGVEHLGTLSRAEVAELMRRSDVFLDLSSYQAFGRTGLEAMACGAVAVLPQAGGVAEYAIDGWNAVLVDTADEDRVVEATRTLVEDGGLRGHLRDNGIESSRAFTTTRAALSQYAAFAAARDYR